MRQRSLSTLQALSLCAALSCLGTGCASVEFDRTTENSGTYVSSGWAMTIFSIDMPANAVQIARENASDAGLENMIERRAGITPDWGWWNWVLDIISIRKARVSGTWGFDDAH